MKFGKSFEEALKSDQFPEDWRTAAIQYKELKVPLSFDNESRY